MIKSPKNATNKQIEIYVKNINKYPLLGLCCDLGIQDYIDEEKFINRCPYNPF